MVSLSPAKLRNSDACLAWGIPTLTCELFSCGAVAWQGALRHHTGVERAGGHRAVVRGQEHRRRLAGRGRLRLVQLLLRAGLLPAAHGRLLHLLHPHTQARLINNVLL